MEGVKDTTDQKEVINQEGAQEGTQEKTSYTSDEVEQIKKEQEKQLQSNFEKGFQKKITEMKEEFSNVRKGIKEVASDPLNLINIYESDPKVAKLILDEYYDGMSLEAYQIKILGVSPEEVKTSKTVDPKELEKQIRKQIEEEESQKQIEQGYNRFIAENSLAGDDLDKFIEEYKDLTDGKTLYPDKQDKFLKSALYNAGLVSKTHKQDTTKSVAKAMATGKPNSGSDGLKKTASSRVESMRSFMKDQGLYK